MASSSIKKVDIQLGNDIITLDVEGQITVGKDIVLLKDDDDLTSAADWHEQGYTTSSFLSEEEFQRLYDRITEILVKALRGLSIDTTDFSLKKYHQYVTDRQHAEIVASFSSFFFIEEIPIDNNIFEERVSDICNTSLQNDSNEGKPVFLIRMVRPKMKMDFNPPHRDMYLPHIRNMISTWLPIAGCNSRSSLPMVPGSHLWKESDIGRTEGGCVVNGIKFTVPCVTMDQNKLTMIRPPLKKGDILVFSPYIIHGCGANLNDDITRVSLEMRFRRKRR